MFMMVGGAMRKASGHKDKAASRLGGGGETGWVGVGRASRVRGGGD